MKGQADDNRTATRYLLGSLPEAEAERLDELSFTDDEFAETLEAAERELVDAYVRGKLGGVELERFEAHYLASPRRREKVRFAQAFQVFAEKSAAARGAEAATEVPGQSAVGRKGAGRFIIALSALSARRAALRWGAAFAALVLLVAGGWLAFESGRLRPQAPPEQAARESPRPVGQPPPGEPEGRRGDDAASARGVARAPEEGERVGREPEAQRKQADERRGAAERQRRASSPPAGVIPAAIVLAPQVRAAGQIQTANVPARTRYVAVRLELEPNEYSAYRVALLDQSGEQILWRGNKLKASTAGGGKVLDVRFRASLLKPTQVYVLRVTGVSADGASEIVSDYPFRVVE